MGSARTETGLTTKKYKYPAGTDGLEIFLDGRLIGTVRIVEGGFLAIHQRKPSPTVHAAAEQILRSAQRAAMKNLDELEQRLDRLRSLA